ncbi:UNVERIFIED_CONTAM: hypothetical protein Cloal_4307 [Acetivibrio alkalicellulosi]
MNKKLKLLTVSTLLAITISGAGCDFFDRDVDDNIPLPGIESPATSLGEDRAVQEFLGTYFSDLFSKSVEDYSQNLIEGSIPVNITGHIASRTLDEGNNNPEIGIHIPRMVEFGGLAILDYNLMRDDSGSPMIDANYIGVSGESFIYYVKVDVKANGLPNNVFYTNYVQNEETLLFERDESVSGEDAIKEEDYDEIKLRLKYDVEVIQENGSYKVFRQTEANYKPKFQNRRFILNNDFIDRIPYLDENITAEREIYEKEKALVESFFNNLLLIDRERMSLLRTNWDNGIDSFQRFLLDIGVSTVDNKNILLLDEETYKERFNILAFPLQASIRRLISYKSTDVVVHPGYTKNNKVYFVRLEANTEKANAIVGNVTPYTFEYVVTLDDKGEMISSIKLEEYAQAK